MADKQQCRFSKTHEWARDEGGLVVVGISDYAAKQLGDIVFVELPKVGKKVAAEGSFGVIESVKAAVEIYSPVGGEVVEANPAVAKDFEAISKDPFGNGWMIKIKPDAPGQLDALMTVQQYETFLQSPENQH